MVECGVNSHSNHCSCAEYPSSTRILDAEVLAAWLQDGAAVSPAERSGAAQALDHLNAELECRPADDTPKLPIAEHALIATAGENTTSPDS